MQHCSGKILTTGIGKAGHIAKKFAATLCSTATPADFIHPAEGAHGDLGLVSDKDVMIAFSTSGKSREVLEILEMSRHLGVDKIIGVTSHLDSQLREHSDLILDMGTITEPCPLGLTPSASMAVMLAISDALALALLEQKVLPERITVCATTVVIWARCAGGQRAQVDAAANPAGYSGYISNLKPSSVT